jgi:hypothetical protein
MFNKGTFCSPEFVTLYKNLPGNNSRRKFNKGTFCSPEFVTFYEKKKKFTGEIIPEESSTKVHFVALSL